MIAEPMDVDQHGPGRPGGAPDLPEESYAAHPFERLTVVRLSGGGRAGILGPRQRTPACRSIHLPRPSALPKVFPCPEDSMPMRARLSVISTLLLAGLVVGGLPGHRGGPARQAAEGRREADHHEDKAIQKTTEAENHAIDDAIAGSGDASASREGAAQTTGSTASAPTAGETAATSESAAAPAAKPKKAGEGAFVNFDFVPGDRVLFYDDYAGDNVGDFPRRFEFEEGNAEVAEWEGARWLRVSQTSEFLIVLPETLPGGSRWSSTSSPTTRPAGAGRFS